MQKNGEKANQSGRRGNPFLRGTLILTAAGMVVKVLGSLNWIILSRVLGGEGIGLYQMAFPLYLLALNVSSAGIPVAISIITAEKIALRDYHGAIRVFRMSVGILLVTGLTLSLTLLFNTGWLIDHRIIRDPRAYYPLIALSPAILFATILSSFRGYLQGWQIMTPTAVSQIVEQVFRVGAMLVLANLLLPRGLEYAAGGASLGAGAGAAAGLVVLIYYYYKLKIRQPSSVVAITQNAQESGISIVRRITRLALPVSLSSIMLPLVANLDLLIVPRRLEDAGYSIEQATELFGYLTGMAVPLVNLSTIFTAAMATSIVPAISEAASLNNTDGIRHRTSSVVRLTYLVTLPGVVVLLLLAEPISTLIYNAPRASGAVEVLSIAVFFLGIHQVTTGVLQGLGRTFVPVVNMGISAILKVILNWTLTAIPLLGIKGAAWATVADIGVAAALNLFWIWRHSSFSFNTPTLLKTVLAAITMGTSMALAGDLLTSLGIGNFPVTIASLATGSFVYGTSLLALGVVNKQDIARIPIVGEVLMRQLSRIGLLK